MKSLLLALSVFSTLAFSVTASALDIFACEPEWGALSQEIGGDRVSIYVATNAFQDPHHIQARPSLLARARRAQLVVCTGSELEIGWLPVVLRQSGNDAVQPGKPGYFEAATYVKKLEVPNRLDRAEGDIHPGGNPHIQTDPRNISLVAEALIQRLAEVDPQNASFYRARYQDFSKRWAAAIQKWEKDAAPLKGVAVVTHHDNWIYLFTWLGMHEIAELEPKPGVEPTAAHLEEVLEQLKREPARMIIRSAYQNERASVWLSDRAKIPVVILPFTVGGTEGSKDLFGLYDDTVQRLLEALK
jgi:zinc/manganese transport system substrate-binding protein